MAKKGTFCLILVAGYIYFIFCTLTIILQQPLHTSVNVREPFTKCCCTDTDIKLLILCTRMYMDWTFAIVSCANLGEIN